MNQYASQTRPSISHFILQPALVIIFLIAVLYAFYVTEHDNILWAVSVGALASSAYTVFTKPSLNSAHPARLVGAYFIAIFSGVMTHFFGGHFLMAQETALVHASFFRVGILTAVAMGIALWLMLWLHAEHPPATGVALILVLDVNDYLTPLIVLAAAIVLVTMKYVLRHWLCDLY